MQSKEEKKAQVLWKTWGTVYTFLKSRIHEGALDKASLCLEKKKH